MSPAVPPDGRSAIGDFDRVEQLFAAAVPLDQSNRAILLDESCADRPDLRAEVDALLDAHDRLATCDSDSPPDGRISPGATVGAYRIVERIAEGGMGEVYLAERADGLYTQQVAVKLTRTSVGHSEDRRRFTVERQILASLKHEHIVRLLDGGTTASGQAFLIMEHVEGVPLTAHCRTHMLSLEARLRLFQQVCAGVQYAHQHGVVHRDLKPANILVDRDQNTKVVDFGIAKLLEGNAADGATSTGLPGPLTPNYASPEQLRGLPVTTVSDVYSLGIILYELVSGARPYETQGQTFERVLEIVVHDHRARPSAGVARESSVSGEERRPASLPYGLEGLRGDIDAIVLKAIAKEPSDRYASASELAADIARFLEREPVLARAPSTAYVLRRLAMRHKRFVGLAAAALLVILTTSGVAVWQWRAASVAQARAEQRFRDVRQLANALIFKIHDAVVPLPGSTSVRRTIVDEAIGYLERLEADSGGDPALRLELANAYRQIGGILGNVGAANLGDRNGAIKQYERAREMLLPLATESAAFAVVDGLVEAELRLSNLHQQSGEREKAVALAREAVDHATRESKRAPNDDRVSSLTARANFGLALVLPNDEAPPVWRRTLDYYERVLTLHPDDRNAQRNVALTAKYLGSLLETTRDWEGARVQYKRALELDETRLQATPDDPRVQFDAAMSYSGAAAVEAQLGNIQAAGPLFERSLALRRHLAVIDPTNMQALGRLGYLLARVAHFHVEHGDLDVAGRLAREAIPVLTKVYDSTGFVSARGDLAFAWLQLGYVEQRTAGGRAGAGCEAFQQAAAQFGDPQGAQTPTGHENFSGDARAEAARCRS